MGDILSFGIKNAVTLSATTAALCDFGAPLFTVVESKGAFGLFRVYRSVLHDVISRSHRSRISSRCTDDVRWRLEA